MARRTGPRWRRLAFSAALLPAGLAAAAPAATTPPATRAPARTDKAAGKAETPKAPDIALLDYLGRYADAADGMDPLGISALNRDLTADPAAAGGP